MTAPIKLALLIDDNEIDQRHYDRLIKRSGLIDELMSFTYAEDALDYLIANPEADIDLIFLDINMPRMDGFEFLEAAADRIGENFAKFVVVMLTTSLDPADRERAEVFDVVKDFISKPLTIEHLQAIANRLADWR